MIKKFDEQGLKELNNRLVKQDKLIKKLMKGGVTGSSSTSTSTGTNNLVPETTIGDIVDTVPAYGVTREDGRVELYDISGDVDADISPTSTAYVHETQARTAVPSGYYLDLRGEKASLTTCTFTADVLILHDENGNTITLTNVDETNDIDDVQTGSVAGKRDKAGAFATTHIHFFIIFNPSTQDVSSLSSESPIDPTLPEGYTFYIRVGSNKLILGLLSADGQLGDIIWNRVVALDDGDPGEANTYQSLDISAAVPATAKSVFGIIGLTQSSAAVRGIGVASNVSGLNEVLVSVDPGGVVEGYEPRAGTYFNIPLKTAQTIFWKGSHDSGIYGITILGYQDDL